LSFLGVELLLELPLRGVELEEDRGVVFGETTALGVRGFGSRVRGVEGFDFGVIDPERGEEEEEFDFLIFFILSNNDISSKPPFGFSSIFFASNIS
jgi:hypothetical protein